MPTELARASFDDIEFPVRGHRIRGGIRDHIHEYPHADGGKPEKLGRKLYVITMNAVFYDAFKRYGDLWPGKLADLRRRFELSTTAKLVVPTIGSISAYCRNWDQDMDYRILSGETCALEFVEDDELGFAIDLDFVAAGASSISSLLAAVTPPIGATAADRSLFEKLNDAVNQVLSYQGEADKVGRILESRISYATGLCSSIDSLATMRSADQARLLDSLHALWDTLQTLGQNVTQAAGALQTWTVPVRSSVTDISTAIFGDASHAMEILQTNPIEDPYSIPAGTQLVYRKAA
jgi:prophage DNA circulation protein